MVTTTSPMQASTTGTSEPEPEQETTAEPEPQPETTAEPELESTTPSSIDQRCETCTGSSPCIWTDGVCYSAVAQAVCEGTAGAVFCGAASVAAVQASSHEPQAMRRKGAARSESFLGHALIQAQAALGRAQKTVEEL